MKKRKRNPNGEQEAAAMSESFHGRPAKEYIDIEGERLERRVLAQLGRLVYLAIETLEGERYKLRPSGARLACSPDGLQLFIEGGDQAVDLKSLGFEGSMVKDHVDLGDLYKLSYHTQKSFHNFEQVDYWHNLGEESGITPTLHYDRLNQLLYITGGNYRVQPEGIVD